MTLLNSFIALRRETITTMMFSFFFPCFPLSFSLFVLAFNKILTQNLKIVIPGPTDGFWPHAFSLLSHPPSPPMCTCLCVRTSTRRTAYRSGYGCSQAPRTRLCSPGCKHMLRPRCTLALACCYSPWSHLCKPNNSGMAVGYD